MTDAPVSAPAAPAMELTVIPPTALETLTRAEMDTQIITARKFRRSLAAFKVQALSMATGDQETAASCSYAVPRDGKIIEGPSIRLAEIVLATWGNLRAGARLIAEDEKTVTAQGSCHDLENNVAITVEVRRRITDRRGVRYKEDMVTTTANAACAIALRNATFKVVPLVFVEQIRQQALRTAAGDDKTLEARRTAAVAHFATLGVPLERLLERLGEGATPKTGLEDIGLKDVMLLHGFATSIRDGVATVDELFPVVAAEAPGSTAGRLADELKGRRTKKPETPDTP